MPNKPNKLYSIILQGQFSNEEDDDDEMELNLALLDTYLVPMIHLEYRLNREYYLGEFASQDCKFFGFSSSPNGDIMANVEAPNKKVANAFCGWLIPVDDSFNYCGKNWRLYLDKPNLG